MNGEVDGGYEEEEARAERRTTKPSRDRPSALLIPPFPHSPYHHHHITISIVVVVVVVMATVSETADSYPELDAIPAATPRPAISRAHSSLSVPIPSWARALFARFPLHTWEPAQPAPLASSPPTKPILYVAPPHPPRAGPSATGDKAAQGWASRDASSLEWQVELLFRGFDFDCAYIEEKEAWGPGGESRAQKRKSVPHRLIAVAEWVWLHRYAGTLPYLHLPPSAQSRAGARGGGALVSARALPQWIETHAPIVKPELGQSNENGDDGYPDEKTREEAKAWASLVEGKLMAAVVSLGDIHFRFRLCRSGCLGRICVWSWGGLSSERRLFNFYIF